MCQSRLHLVRSVTGPGKVLVEDIDGRRHEVSLLAPEPSEPESAPGERLVVHSGYPIDRKVGPRPRRGGLVPPVCMASLWPRW